VERRRLSVYFLYLAWPLWKSVVTLAVTGNKYLRSGFLVSQGDVVSAGTDCVFPRPLTHRMSGHTVSERSWKDADCLCIRCIQRHGYFKVM
jgi:hypothetical protein